MNDGIVAARPRCGSGPWAMLLLGCALVSTAPANAGDANGTAHPDQWPRVLQASLRDTATEATVDRLLGSMTTEEKVGQLIQADIASIRPEDLAVYPLGSILAGGNAAPENDVRVAADRWLALTDAFHRAALARPGAGHAPIPLLFGIDAVHGHARIIGATVFPHNVGLGATHDPALIEQIGRATAEEIAATGIDWTFAPTVAVVRDVRWGRSYESFSEDPRLVATDASAMVAGLQGRIGTPDFLAPGRVLASAKHFIGDGGTIDGRDQFDNTSSERQLRDIHAAGYPAALGAGALIVMASYNSWHGVKMHANRSLLTDVLKDRWSFPGFVVGDWNATEEIPGCTKFSCSKAVMAGLDMYMAPDSWKQLYANVLQQVHSGEITTDRLDDAVRRILRVKALAGRLLAPTDAGAARSNRLAELGSEAHRALARSAVRESLVLLKNNKRVLPLSPQINVLVAGDGADDIAMQCGGWTVDWQGDHNTNRDFPGATSIFAGIQATVAASGGHATLRPDGRYTERPDAAIVVFGEPPYAEFEGDRESLKFAQRKSAHLAIMRRLHAAGIPVVSVFMSGRPMWVNPELNASDAFVAAWLPGTEGGGVADALFSNDSARTQDFRGRLAFSWPATASPVHFTDSGAVLGSLFPRGFGLSLASTRQLGRLGEDPHLPAGSPGSDSLFGARHVTAPWSVYVADTTAEVRLTMRTQSSPAGAVTATLHPDGVRADWSGTGRGEFRIGGRAADYRSPTSPELTVTARYRVDASPTTAVAVGIRCDAPYGTKPQPAAATRIEWKYCGTQNGALLDETSAFAVARRGTWHTLRVPLSCLMRRGATLADVSAPFVIETAGRLAVTIASVHLERSRSGETCSAPLTAGDRDATAQQREFHHQSVTSGKTP